MKKRLAIVLTALALLLTTLPVYAAGASIDIRVTPSKSQIKVGETVEYVVTATGEDVVAMQFELRFPEGLSYVQNTGATPENLAQKLGVPAADWTELTHMFTFYNDVGITIKQGTELLRFTCKAEKAGEYEVVLYELLPFDSNFEEFAPKVTVEPVKVSAPQGQTQPPATLPAATEPPATLPTLPAATLPAATEPTATEPVEGTVISIPQATEPTVSTDATIEATTGSQEETTVDSTGTAEEPTVPDTTQEQGTEEPTQQKPSEQQTDVEKKPSAAPWVILVSVAAVAAVAAAAIAVFLLKKKQN